MRLCWFKYKNTCLCVCTHYTITLRTKTFSDKSMSEKTFRILQDERILYLYIGAILTNILFCFNAALDFSGDLYMLRAEGDSLTKLLMQSNVNA